MDGSISSTRSSSISGSSLPHAEPAGGVCVPMAARPGAGADAARSAAVGVRGGVSPGSAAGSAASSPPVRLRRPNDRPGDSVVAQRSRT
ncbi:hypothetical protein [Pseudonocardia sp. ICBG601]|uniref:hypothetical protein n=1 Tax=Pseudonocardia sp. ICBG601 TaxID=2846759 RepID=UPI001CF68226|nr:hypothetical protein [Pseudonocardia sp. ICBG601]